MCQFKVAKLHRKQWRLPMSFHIPSIFSMFRSIPSCPIKELYDLLCCSLVFYSFSLHQHINLHTNKPSVTLRDHKCDQGVLWEPVAEICRLQWERDFDKLREPGEAWSLTLVDRQRKPKNSKQQSTRRESTHARESIEKAQEDHPWEYLL